MSKMPLPLTVNPVKLAEQGTELVGSIPLSKLPRVSELLVSSEGDVNAELVFGRDEQRLRILSGKLSCDVSMACQRCLEPVTKSIHSEFVLGLVLTDEQAVNLPKIYEPLMVELDDNMELSDILDEELLLSVPMFAYHEPKDCKVDASIVDFYDQDVEVEAVEDTKPNPFGVLSNIKFDK